MSQTIKKLTRKQTPFIKKSGRVIIEGSQITVEGFNVDYDNPVCDGCGSVAIAGATWALKKLAEAIARDANGKPNGIGLG